MFALARIVAFRNKAWSSATAPKTVDISNGLFPTVDPDEVVRCLKADGLFEGFQIPNGLHRNSEFRQAHPVSAISTGRSSSCLTIIVLRNARLEEPFSQGTSLKGAEL